MTKRPHAILLVDDDPLVLFGLKTDLEAEGHAVTTAESGEIAVKMISVGSFDLVITDLVMEGIDGLEVLKSAKTAKVDTPVIILTGFGDLDSAVAALRLSADDFLIKPCDPGELRFRVAKCMEKFELHRKIRAYEGILPVCCVCKKIRDDNGRAPGSGEWMSVERYLWKRAGLGRPRPIARSARLGS